MFEQELRTKRKGAFYLLLFLIPVVTIALMYLGYTVFRTSQFYTYVKSDQRGWSGKVHGVHKELGFAPIPNSRGSEIMPLGPDIPMRYDKDIDQENSCNEFADQIAQTMAAGCEEPSYVNSNI